ncbi:MAG: glycoside hydrolase family 88 protein, partial [Bacteroidota bacterium]
ETLNNVQGKMSDLLTESLAVNKIPRSEEENGEIMWATKMSATGDMKFDWTLGFFPGSCWYMYEATGEERWKEAAENLQGQFADFQHFKGSHDLGFVFYCSYGNGWRVSQNEQYKQVLIEAGNTLLTRFNPTVGCLQSWDVTSGWQAKRGWKYPVIIDNMMNLEMLFELTALTGDPKYREVAIIHADKTLENHFRPDNSSYHVLDYDPETGAVRKKCTAQGYADESAWARGQAWGLYGFVVCYRYTKDKKYLEQAIRIADFITNHPQLPEDGVPYWDYNAPNIPEEPRDVSAAAIAASALIELNSYTGNQYEAFVQRVMNSLASEKYSVPSGRDTKFVLDHSVGSIPHGSEIDQPLVYADYYFIEALIRMRKANQASSQEISRS